MNDFSFNDSFEEEETGGYNEDQNEKKKIVKFLIIVVVAAIVGFTVYFVTDALINGNRKPVPTVRKDMEMELSDEMVVYLYSNVKYEVNGVRSDRFFKSGSVTADDFTNQEKMYFALRYATKSDFVNMSSSNDSEEVNDEDCIVCDSAGGICCPSREPAEKEKPTFSISKLKIDEYMFNFFGEGVSYSTDSPINVAVNFTVDGFNSGVMNYDLASDSFLIKFDSTSPGMNTMAINPYLYKLESALREGKTDHIILKEKVVFTTSKQYESGPGNFIDKYDCSIYSDFARTNLLEQKTGVVKSQLGMLGIENYQENASTVTYTFEKDENDEYHFLSSQIE